MSEAGTVFRGAEVFDGEQLIGACDVVVSGERVATITEPQDDRHYRESQARIIEARELLLSPGFVDLHCHLRDPGQTWKEDIFSGSAAAAAGGYTTVVCMPNTDPPVDRAAVADYIRDRGERAALCRVVSAGCLTRGRAGEELAELAGLYAAGVRIFSDDGSDTRRADTLLHALEFLSMFPGTRVLVHSEVRELAAGVMHEGEVSALLGHPGIHRLSEDIGAARAILTALEAGQPLQVTHVASATVLDLARYGKVRGGQGGRPGLISVDATIHHLLLTEEAVREHGALAKVNPPLRSEVDRQALLGAVGDGTLDAIVTDHAPHTVDEKAQELEHAPFGIVGFESAFGLLHKHLVGQLAPTGEIGLERVLRLLTSGPAEIAAGTSGQGLPLPPQLAEGSLADFHPRTITVSPGRIAEGGLADLTLIDLNAEWEVDPARFKSKGRNTPFAGWPAKGKVLLTMMGGKVTHEIEGVVPGQAGGVGA